MDHPARTETYYVSLYVADPKEQPASEATYGGYQRMKATFTIVNGVARNTTDVGFPECSGEGNKITHVGISNSKEGADLACSGEIRPKLVNVTDKVSLSFMKGMLVFDL